MPVIRLLSFATVMLAAAAVAAPTPNTEAEITSYMDGVQTLMDKAKESRDYAEASINIDVKSKALEKEFDSKKTSNDALV